MLTLFRIFAKSTSIATILEREERWRSENQFRHINHRKRISKT